MTKERIMKIVDENNGYIYSRILRENQIPTIYITRLVNDGKLHKVARGIYVSENGIEDEYFINSILHSKIVFSGETALFLNGLSNKQYPENEITIPYGSTTPKIFGYKTIVCRKKTFELGIVVLKTMFGNEVNCYDKERCICDLFIRPDRYEYEDRIFAINEYKNKYLDLKKLFEYAKKLNVYETVKNVFEVITWN